MEAVVAANTSDDPYEQYTHLGWSRDKMFCAIGQRTQPYWDIPVMELPTTPSNHDPVAVTGPRCCAAAAVARKGTVFISGP